MTLVLKIKEITADIIENMNSEKYKEQYLDWLLESKDNYIDNTDFKLAIIKNKNTPLNILLEFYQNYNYNYEILLYVLEYRISKIKDLSILKEFSLNEDNLIISSLIKNDNINDEIIKTILKYNKKSWVELLLDYKRLSLDKIIDINENSSYGLKDKAYLYLEEYVSKITSPVKLEKLMDYTSKDLNYFISQSKYLTEELFSLLSHSNDFQTRSILAERLDTPMDILYMFVDDESDSVRLGLAKNINSDTFILALLAKNNKSTILKKVIINPNTSKEILKSIMNMEAITEEIILLSKLQFNNLNNLNVEINHEYYSLLEGLKFGDFDTIEIQKKESVERKKIVVELSDNY